MSTKKHLGSPIDEKVVNDDEVAAADSKVKEESELSEGERVDYSDFDEDENENENENEDEEEEDEDEDEDEDDNLRPAKRRRKHKGRSAISSFFELEAGEEEGEEEEESEEGEGDFIGDDEEREAEELAREMSRPRPVFNRAPAEEALDAEAEAERLRKLYRTRRTVTEGLGEKLARPFLIPRLSDPKLWMIKCKHGRERDIVLKLTQAAIERQYTENPLPIVSAICRDNLGGFIYVEAHKPASVREAIEAAHLEHVAFAGKPILVPPTEMSEVLLAPPQKIQKEAELKAGSWVRVKKGKYANDLAKVIDVIEPDLARIKLVPRLSYRGASSQAAPSRRRGQNRPMPALFDPRDASLHGSVSKSRGFWMFGGETFRDGYLVKDVRLTSLLLDAIVPTIEELEKFEASSDFDALNEKELETLSLVPQGHRFQEGDRVIVMDGDLVNMMGIVNSVRGDTDRTTAESGTIGDDAEVIVTLNHEDLKEPLTFRAAQLRKHFRTGDLVTVTHGKNKGESGMVVDTEQDKGLITIYSDIVSKEMKVFARDVQDSASATIPSELTQIQARGYELYDLVQMDSANFGIITRIIDNDNLRIIDQHGTTQAVQVKQISGGKRNSRNNIALDADSRPIQIGDMVDLLDGSGQATVLHVYQNTLFLQPKDSTAEPLVKRPNGVRAKPTNTFAVPLVGRSTDFARNPMHSSAANSWDGGSKFTGTGGLVGKTIKIAGGPYKGYIGFAKEVTETTVRVELHTNSKLVQVDRDKIIIPDAMDSRRMATGRTPGYVGKTPSWDQSGRTPAWNSQAKTPAWDSSSKTPAWNMGSKTPAWNAGSKTPAWNIGTKTPAWDGGRTPAWENAPSRTPAWTESTTVGGSGGRTPMWQTTLPKTPTWQSESSSNPAINPTTGKTILPSWAVLGAEIRRIDANVGDPSKSMSYIIRAIAPTFQISPAIGGARISIAFDQLSSYVPVIPGKKDRVQIVAHSDLSGLTGTLIGLDGPDGVVRLDGSADFKILPLGNIVKAHKL